MIQVCDLCFAYGDKTIFDRLNFSIAEGDLLTIIGPNGCGKSTLLRLLRGSLFADSGEIKWDGIPIRKLSTHNLARRVAVVPQSSRVDFPYKVHEVVAMGRFPHRQGFFSLAGEEDRRQIRHALALTDILEFAQRPVTQLSGGELQRVLLARALAQQAKVLFLDEATSHLDIDHRLELSELLLRLNREQGVTIVQISHDLELAAAMSRRVLMLTEQARPTLIGPPTDVMTAANLRQVFRVDIRVETNPFTGAPHIFPLLNCVVHQLQGLKIHLICGGGSGQVLLRRLHLAQAQLSVGPLNRGDSDEITATALGISCIHERPYSPYSSKALEAAGNTIAAADLLIISTRCWGEGNLACLDLAEQALRQGQAVYIMAADRIEDYSGGKATARIEQLCSLRAQSVDKVETMLELLKSRYAPLSP